MGGNPAHAVVASQTVEAVLDDPDADHASGLAAVFLSAPPGDPVADALNGATAEAHANGKAGDTNGTAYLAGPGAGIGAALGSEIGNGNLLADSEPSEPVTRPMDVTTGALVPDTLLPELIASEAISSQAAAGSAVWDASNLVTEIYTAHYNQLVRLAVMLVHDLQTAEEVVQDAFETMHMAERRLRDSEKALSYLRQTTVNKARSVLRHRKVVEMHAPKPAPDEQSAEHAALTLIERSAVTSALRALPERQREAIVLRYYGDFSEADIAKAMGISKGAVKSHTARAIAALKSALEGS